MVTRRVHKRQMLLVGNEDVTQIIKYTLAYCLQKYNMELHAITTEGNHIHRVDTDPDARRPDFNRDFHSLLGRQINHYYNEEDAFFSNKQTSVVHNESADDILRRIVYTLGNPVADGIEREGVNHKGMRLRWPQPDEVIQRPRAFWRTLEKGGVAPDEVTLSFHRPPGYEGLSDEELDNLLDTRVLTYEKEKRDERLEEGKKFRCDFTDELPDPKSFPKSRSILFGLSPQIGAALKKDRLRAIARLRNFRKKHEEARLRRQAGDYEATFPFGTWLAVQRWNVPVDPDRYQTDPAPT